MFKKRTRSSFEAPTLIILLLTFSSKMATQTKMKAVNYQGPFKVKVEEVDRPKIEHPDDVIVRITTSAICGSDLQ